MNFFYFSIYFSRNGYSNLMVIVWEPLSFVSVRTRTARVQCIRKMFQKIVASRCTATSTQYTRGSGCNSLLAITWEPLSFLSLTADIVGGLAVGGEGSFSCTVFAGVLFTSRERCQWASVSKEWSCGVLVRPTPGFLFLCQKYSVIPFSLVRNKLSG